MSCFSRKQAAGHRARPGAGLVLLLVFKIQAATSTRHGGGGDANWFTAGNWLSGIPTTITDTLFKTNGTAFDSSYNNIITVNANVQTLRYVNTSINGINTFQKTYINDEITLTISNVL